MLIAQALGEYGGLAGGFSGGITNFLDTVEYTVRDAQPTTWIVVGFGVLVVWFLFFRQR